MLVTGIILHVHRKYNYLYHWYYCNNQAIDLSTYWHEERSYKIKDEAFKTCQTKNTSRDPCHGCQWCPTEKKFQATCYNRLEANGNKNTALINIHTKHKRKVKYQESFPKPTARDIAIALSAQLWSLKAFQPYLDESTLGTLYQLFSSQTKTQ